MEKGTENRSLNTAQAADYIGFSRKTLEGWRASDQGPPYIKAAGRVFYRSADLDAWIENNRVTPSGNPK